MKKMYILEDLDCAHCAGEIEAAVGKLAGVQSSSVAFLTRKMVVEVDDEKADKITKEIKKVVKKFEPDVEVIEK